MIRDPRPRELDDDEQLDTGTRIGTARTMAEQDAATRAVTAAFMRDAREAADRRAAAQTMPIQRGPARARRDLSVPPELDEQLDLFGDQAGAVAK